MNTLSPIYKETVRREIASLPAEDRVKKIEMMRAGIATVPVALRAEFQDAIRIAESTHYRLQIQERPRTVVTEIPDPLPSYWTPQRKAAAVKAVGFLSVCGAGFAGAIALFVSAPWIGLLPVAWFVLSGLFSGGQKAEGRQAGADGSAQTINVQVNVNAGNGNQSL
jgi:hypothetical protein